MEFNFVDGAHFANTTMPDGSIKNPGEWDSVVNTKMPDGSIKNPHNRNETKKRGVGEG